MSVEIKLKGNWAPDGTDIDKAHSYYKETDRIILQDNDFGLNERWYPLENVARVDTK
jgi:hypothetical protein